MADINKYFADEYDSTKSYTKGDKCVYENKWYQCISPTTGEFNPDCWKNKYLTDYIGGGSNYDGLCILSEPVITDTYTQSGKINANYELDRKTFTAFIDGTLNISFSARWGTNNISIGAWFHGYYKIDGVKTKIPATGSASSLSLTFSIDVKKGQKIVFGSVLNSSNESQYNTTVTFTINNVKE